MRRLKSKAEIRNMRISQISFPDGEVIKGKDLNLCEALERKNDEPSRRLLNAIHKVTFNSKSATKGEKHG